MSIRSFLRLGGALLLVGALWIALAVSAQASSADAVWPQHPGEVVSNDGKLSVDESNSAQGYVMCCVSAPSDRGMKLRVTYNGTQLMYDLDNSGRYEVFPLQLGSGKYVFELFENVKSTKYSAEGKVTLTVDLADENAAFLVSNQYVNYNFKSATVRASDEITGGASGDKEIYKAVCDYMADNFSYDFVRAKNIGAGVLPEVDPCFNKKSGICQDLSAVMVCMLRVQGIPAKLMIGYADKYYHAWTVAVVDGEEVFFDPTAAIGCLNAKKYATERYY